MKSAREEYADIIDREHHVSKWHKPMPRLTRAAQFSPFAALVGYDDLVAESARLTDDLIDVSDDSRSALDARLAWLLAQDPAPEATFSVFVPDAKKAGGSYETVTGIIKKHDPVAQTIVLTDKRTLRIADIVEIACAEFDGFLSGSADNS